MVKGDILLATVVTVALWNQGKFRGRPSASRVGSPFDMAMDAWSLVAFIRLRGVRACVLPTGGNPGGEGAACCVRLRVRLQIRGSTFGTRFGAGSWAYSSRSSLFTVEGTRHDTISRLFHFKRSTVFITMCSDGVGMRQALRCVYLPASWVRVRGRLKVRGSGATAPEIQKIGRLGVSPPKTESGCARDKPVQA